VSLSVMPYSLCNLDKCTTIVWWACGCSFNVRIYSSYRDWNSF